MGAGQLQGRLKLWVDFGCTVPANSDLLFALRISSAGQPFGYPLATPNEKFRLDERRTKIEMWRGKRGIARFDANEAFKVAAGSDLLGAVSIAGLPSDPPNEQKAFCILPLSEIVLELVQQSEALQAIAALQIRHPHIPKKSLHAFVTALDRTLNATILFQVIDPAVVEDEKEYIRFFGRLGQGGTALSNDELTYSIIKHHFPNVHDRMKEITGGEAGRLASEVNLVLAALRVAKVSAPSDKVDWHHFGRPYPAFVSKIVNGERKLAGVRDEFLRLIPTESEPYQKGGMLKGLLESIRLQLVYEKTTNPNGLPTMLLARLPHQLIDVLVLMAAHPQKHAESSNLLPAFVLYWLLFVADSEKAADLVFEKFCRKQADWHPNAEQKLIRQFEEKQIARRLPNLLLLDAARKEINDSTTHKLRHWNERFTALDANNEHPCGDALRVLTTHSNLIRCALMWLQRDYLSEHFQSFDPTSARDEDLPIDLDHLIPNSKFGFNWSHRETSLGFSDEKENFRYQRGTVGNSLGNYRWLDASVNRSRQAKPIEDADAERDTIYDVSAWNTLIGKTQWAQDEVNAFQKMIDLRSIELCGKLLSESGLAAFAMSADTEPKPTGT